MSKINPKKLKQIFTQDVLDILPSNRNIKIGAANLAKGNDPQIVDKIRDKVTKSWQDPDHREKMKKVHADRSQTAWKQNVAEGNKWINKSEEAKKNILASREALKTNKKFKDSIKKRDADSKWLAANKVASQKKWKDPDNIKTCPHCEKQMSANTYDRHLKSCLFVKGPITTYKGEVAEFEYATEQALVDDGFDMMRIKQVINTNKEHGGYLFKQ